MRHAVGVGAVCSGRLPRARHAASRAAKASCIMHLDDVLEHVNRGELRGAVGICRSTGVAAARYLQRIESQNPEAAEVALRGRV